MGIKDHARRRVLYKTLHTALWHIGDPMIFVLRAVSVVLGVIGPVGTINERNSI